MKARNIRLLLTVLFLTLMATLGMVGLTACVDTPEAPETDPDTTAPITEPDTPADTEPPTEESTEPPTEPAESDTEPEEEPAAPALGDRIDLVAHTLTAGDGKITLTMAAEVKEAGLTGTVKLTLSDASGTISESS
ncbi:MAG: hypothetical protein IJ363_04030, partial [Clostridia bacterium]|nr:hypothetical protein [Clostridia bacterium]